MFTYDTSVLWEVGEVIELIFTPRFFLNLLKLFLGPYIFIKQYKNWGSTVGGQLFCFQARVRHISDISYRTL